MARWAVLGAVAVATSLLLFGPEPSTLDDGTSNPLADIPLWTGVLTLVVLVVVAVPLVRRPAVAANHYALTVRPGPLRTLLLPWAGVAEVVALPVGDEAYLLVRLSPDPGAPGDRPGFWDQLVLRGARKSTEKAKGYDVAVRLREFAGPPQGKLAALAAFAPETVHIDDQL